MSEYFRRAADASRAALGACARAAEGAIDGMVGRAVGPTAAALGADLAPAEPGAAEPSIADGSPAADRDPGVERQLERAAVLVMSADETPGQADPVAYGDTDMLVGIDLARDVRRFDVLMDPALSAAGGWSTVRRGQAVGHLDVRFRLAPPGFAPAPGCDPPPTPLDPGRGQPFVLSDGCIRFRDRPETTLRFRGSGTTVPTAEGGRPTVRLEGVLHLTDGQGRLRGAGGTGTVTGVLTPPNRVRLTLVFRIPEPPADVLVTSRLRPVQWTESPSPRGAWLTLRGEADPASPRMPVPAPGGGLAGAHMRERLRVINAGFDLGYDRAGLRARTVTGPVVAEVSHTTLFRGGRFAMTEVFFQFFDDAGAEIGTLRAPRVDGAVTPVTLPRGGPQGLLIAGAGAVGEPTGSAPGRGTVMVNAGLTLTPNAFSTVYVLRLDAA
jgi:hypothetical protein